MKRYRVVADLQGGEFGMGRDYTAEEWLQQAVEWRDSDGSWGDYGEGIDCYGNKHLDSRSWFIKFWKRMIKDGKEQELIDYIADIWSLEIEEIRFEDWGDELKYRVELEGEDEKGAGGVYDMALDITDLVYEILVKNNSKSEVDKLYYPDVEIECAIYDAIKYGIGVKGE